MFPSTLRPLVGALLLSAGVAAQAATLLVTVKTDSYDGICNLHCSLRDAVAVANQAPNADTILLLAGTYILTRPLALDTNGLPLEDNNHQSGDLDVLGVLRIRGLDTTKTIIQGQYNDRLFEVLPGAQLTVEKLTLEKGNSAHNGGAVKNQGKLTLRETRVQGNQALYPQQAPLPAGKYTNAQGGAFANYGELTLVNSRLQDNTATGASMGDYTGRGGALFNDQGKVAIQGSLFFRNIAKDHGDGGDGGAIYNRMGDIDIERSTFAAHGGQEFSRPALINDEGRMALTNSTLTQNDRGTLANLRWAPGATAQLTLTQVTVTGSFPIDSYALVNSGDLTIYNSLIAGNYDISIAEAPANCINKGSYYTYQATGLLIGDEPSNCTGDYYVSFEDTYTKVLSPTLTKPSETVWFHALLPGSPAIDAGVGDCVPHDQRGAPRPQDGNGDGVAVCDLGAHEFTP